ncbi:MULTISPECIES: restriction endonuclease subunit S [unclassified Roseburia]|uniref:restriction endonuclease subunit S n=1 Tax=unclassified Roseburia TaxID=2637578 RepID=UPI000E4EAD2D|nr:MULTISPECIES: restriction endonuclease subunit S [unclassified Roseburia]RHQ40313.1 restriction endonuclease subunit S [Roseburia sp. AF25-25LB]RHQ42501.1 restriction endonuclease subunit S [Roseburia sp. AF25-18LB]RHQ48923.1 restriction endonuclease subunit S [Roseburia sp. AF25-15LB]RHQ49410.1 restriction endonuclease subunit S [Roseburia sp. AF25-13LB]
MREMKDSGISWINEIPRNWNVEPIKYSYRLIAGATPESTNVDFWDGDIKWITPADFKTKDVFVTGGSRNLTIEGYKSCSTSMLPIGSIVFSKRAPIGTVAITADKLCTNQGCLGLVEKSGRVLNKFYFYVISIYGEVFNLYGSGTTFKEISANTFANIKLPMPPIQEQKSIVGFLDAKCAEIDALSADIQTQIDTLEQYKRSVITEAVTKGLNPDVEMKDSGLKWIGKIPSSWNVMPNKYLMKKKKVICPVYNGEDILSLTMKGVIVRDLDAGGKMPTSFDGYQRLEPGNLLMCLFDIDVTPRCIGLIKQEGLSSPAYSQFELNDMGNAKYYCYYYTMLDNDKTLLHLAKNLRHSLTEDQLGAISVIVPPVQEQKRIAKFLDAKCEEIDKVIAAKIEQLALIDEYKKSLIYEYVTGKKEVSAI